MEKLKAVASMDMFRNNRTIKTILSNMGKRQNGSVYSIMLSGDPGIGKTSMMRQLSRLLGIEILVLEAPHIIGEHIIQIPFIVYNPKESETTGHNGAIKASNFIENENTSDFDLVYSNSYLLQELNGKKKIPDDEYIDYIYSQSPQYIKMYEDLGGTKETIPGFIKGARQFYKDILFIDEYFRAPNANIRNILRDLLNRAIGHEKLPATTYVIFASNLKDEGLVGMNSQHQVFRNVNMDNPSSEEWFKWLKNKHADLDAKVVSAFEDFIEDEHISFRDDDTSIRTSPRRWEQLITYIDANLPAKDIKEANSLLASVRANFTNTKGEHSGLATKVYDITKKLIVDSNSELKSEDLEHLSTHDNSEWYQHLKQQIISAKKMGEKRAYVPIVAGAPGIGKNQLISQVASELNMKLILISATSITKDSVIGVPVINKKPKMGTPIDFKFETPPLLLKIYEEAKEADQKFKKEGKKPDENAKYLIYFDELDKVKDKDIFNVLRRVLLEKEFANGEQLPKGSILMGAINPSGTEGSMKFTDHMADVIDVIHAEPNWKDFFGYLNSDKFKIESHENYDNVDKGLIDKIKHNMVMVLSNFVDRFKSPGKNGYFNLIEDDGTKLYVSPRDYTNCVSDATQDVVAEYNDFKEHTAGEKITEDFILQFNKHLKEVAFKAFSDVLSNAWNHKNLDYSDFLNISKTWFLSNNTDGILDGVTMIKGASADTLTETLKHMIENKDFDPTKSYKQGTKEWELQDEFYYYVENADPSDFGEHLRDFVDGYLKHGDKEELPLHKPVHNYEMDGQMHITSPEGDAHQIRLFLKAKKLDGRDPAQAQMKFYYDLLLSESPKFKKDIKKFIQEENEKLDDEKEKLPDYDSKDFLNVVFEHKKSTKDEPNPVTPMARKLGNFMLTKDKGEYVYISELNPDDYAKPLSTSKTYKNAHKLFHDTETDAPVDDFLERVKKAVKSIRKDGVIMDIIDNVEQDVKKLEDEYLLKHVERFA